MIVLTRTRIETKAIDEDPLTADEAEGIRGGPVVDLGEDGEDGDDTDIPELEHRHRRSTTTSKDEDAGVRLPSQDPRPR